jgi:hypothetical protein
MKRISNGFNGLLACLQSIAGMAIDPIYHEVIHVPVGTTQRMKIKALQLYKQRFSC